MATTLSANHAYPTLTGANRQKMLQFLPLYLLAFVVLEMAALIALGRRLGVFPTIMAVLGAGMAGAWLARWQGLRTAMRAREQMTRGALPTKEMTDGLLIVVAAVLLIIPGVITDVLGLLLLFPPTRVMFRRAIIRQFARRSPLGKFTRASRRREHLVRDEIIDARVIETRVVDEEASSERGPSIS